MVYNSLFKILLAALFFYLAFPEISFSLIPSERFFWISWLGLLLLVVGGNLSTLLKITEPPRLERSFKERNRHRNY